MSGQFRPLKGAGGENWNYGKRLLGIDFSKDEKGFTASNERNYALGLLKANTQALGEV